MRTAAMAMAAVMSVLATAPAAAAGLYGPTTVTASGSSSDLAYNRDRGEFLVVWTGDSAQGHLQIWGRRYRESGEAIGAAVPLSDGTVHNGRPRVAYDHHVNRYLVTWERMANAGPALGLKGQLFDTNVAAASPELTFATEEPLGVAIAARNLREHASSDAAFLVTWNTSGGVEAGRVRGDGTLLPVVAVADSWAWSVATAYDPRVDRFLVVYRNGGSIRMRLIGSDGSLEPELIIGSHGSCWGYQVAFDPASRRYLIAWSAPNASNQCEVRGTFYGSSATMPAQLDTITIASGVAGLTHWISGVEAEPGTFVVVAGTHGPSMPTGQQTTRLRRYRADGLFLHDVDLGISHVYSETGLAAGAHGATPVTYTTPWSPQTPMTVQLAMYDRWFARSVHGRGDADADGHSDLTVFQPATSNLTTRTQVTTTTAVFAIPGAQPVLLDWDGDGRSERAVWEPSTGKWWLLRSSDGRSESVRLGRSGDVPVPADYFGLGHDQIAVFRPSTGEWLITSSVRARPTVVTFGQVGDMPVPADWDGDGDIELGLWRPSTGVWTAAQPDGTPVGVPSTAWGGAGDFPFGGDVVGDARADQVVYRRQLGVAWVRDGATGAASTLTLGDGILMPLDWDADGKANLALADMEAGVWRIRSGWLTTTVTFGTTGAIPAAR